MLKDHQFVVGGGEQVVGGKSQWPDMVRLVIPKDIALEFAMTVLRSFQNARPGEDMLMEHALFGKLESFNDDE
jgi:hypothetical protein